MPYFAGPVCMRLRSLKTQKMKKIPIWVIFISFFLVLHGASVVEDEVKNSLIIFLVKLSNNGAQTALRLGWNTSSDPCKDQWQGLNCDSQNVSVTKLFLNSQNLSGTLDVSSLCSSKSLAASLTSLDLDNNNIGGQISAEIENCNQLTRLTVSRNQLSGNLPDSLAALSNLNRLDISDNNFSGDLPKLSGISGLTAFLAQSNQLTGHIPDFDFSDFDTFNVSYNNLEGPIPNVNGHFPASSFMGNPALCGDPLPNKCASASATVDDDNSNTKGVSKNQMFIYMGYGVLALVCVVLVIMRICKKKQKKDQVEAVNKVAAVDESSSKISAASSESKGGLSKSQYSVTFSADNTPMVSSSLIVLTSPVVNGLKFEDLLKAPAELLGRGKYGSLYKVIFENGMVLVVKRIKDWAISSSDFKLRMERLYQAKHPNVLPALAFYCSKQEKLLVYEYQQNGSLFRLIHGSHRGEAFDWPSRLSVAASIAEALAFMHQELRSDGITHGNLKSSNILLNKNMEPCISEYGLMVINDQDNLLPVKKSGRDSASSTFKEDIYGFGVILLELLTGKLVQHNGVDLTVWVHSVVREEWTAEVFDKSLMSECASEERMVNLLQVAIKCVNRSPDARPSMNQVAIMIKTIREEEDSASTVSDPLSMSLL